MSYLVLARKSRPQTFDQVVGQQTIVKTLKNSLKRNRVAHAILFSGVRGVGKTTLARIMAKALNCTSELDNKPCDECDNCREIKSGSSLDLYEIDGASNRGIQEIRELKEKLKYLPTTSKFKIFIIDEVHMLTSEAFNALLKTLEEPPPHVHFMFATTELHKIPITILSRCQRYELKRIPADMLFSHFRSLAESEGVSIEDQALNQIVREAEGSVRDGLSLLDQVFSFGETAITHADVIELLGLVNRDVITDLAVALLKGDKTSALTGLSTIFTAGFDLKRFTTDLLDTYRNFLLLKIEGCETLIDLPESELKKYSSIASSFSSETLHAQLQLLMKIVEDLRFSSQPQLYLETSVLKLIESSNISSVSTLIEKLDSLLDKDIKEIAAVTPPRSSANETKTTTQQKNNAPAARHTEVVEKPPGREKNNEPEAVSTISQKPYIEAAGTEKKNELIEQSETLVSPSSPTQQKARSIKSDWNEFIAYVRDRSIWMSQDLGRVDKNIETDNQLFLHYSDPVNCALLKRPDNHRLLTEFVLDFFQKELKVRFVVPDLDQNTENGDEEGPAKQRHQLLNDPMVTMVTEVFNGQAGNVRIGPRSR